MVDPFELQMLVPAWTSPTNDSTVTTALTPFHNLLPASLQILLFWSKFHLTQPTNCNMPNSRRTLPWLSFPLKWRFCLQPRVTCTALAHSAASTASVLEKPLDWFVTSSAECRSAKDQATPRSAAGRIGALSKAKCGSAVWLLFCRRTTWEHDALSAAKTQYQHNRTISYGFFFNCRLKFRCCILIARN